MAGAYKEAASKGSRISYVQLKAIESSLNKDMPRTRSYLVLFQLPRSCRFYSIELTALLPIKKENEDTKHIGVETIPEWTLYWA